MRTGRQTGSSCAARLVAAALAAWSIGCDAPKVGARVTGAEAEGPGPTVSLEAAELDLHGRVVATLHASEGALPLAHDEVMALRPRFTLAKLVDHPADGQRAWESLLLTGPRVADRVAPGGPDDPDVVTSVRQPGDEAPAALVDLQGGRFRYVFAQPVTGVAWDDTVRVGLYLAGTERPSLRTSSTLDFRPSGAPPEGRDLVLDEACVRCHGQAIVEHETRVGVRLCLTCHTWQATDPLTVDPAAIVSTGTTPRTNPNPLELGRLLHRIHRGKDLPTLYQTAWDGVSLASMAVPYAPAFAPPFVQQKPGAPNRNVIPGRKYSLVGEDGTEHVFAASLLLTSHDPSLGGTMTLAAGGLFPRDLRDCAVCHEGAPQGGWVKQDVSRRTCSGCHPEVWYRGTSPAFDRSRYPHPGGPQADDTACRGCHVAGGARVYAPIEDAHVPPARGPRYNKPVFEIVRVEDLLPGLRPKVTFRVWDRAGPVVPSPSSPRVPFDPSPVDSSYVPRRFAAGGIAIKIIGPVEEDFAGPRRVELNSGAAFGNPDPVTLTTTGLSDEYVYVFGTAATSTLPEGTTGTFLVGMEGRRALAPAGANPYDKVNDVFYWPYTGETVTESPDNVWVYVNVGPGGGTWTRAGGSPGAVPRRDVIEAQKCLRCHDRIEFHSAQRHAPEWCVVCHNPDATDHPQRVNVARQRYPGGPVNVGATFDGVEERSSHFKMNMHRMHTGNREGSASLEAIKPYALYFSKAYFFDRGGFPGDLRDCTLCHVGKSYLLEAVPPGAPPTRGNESAAVWHWDGKSARAGESGGIGLLHPDDEPALLPLQGACVACHATGATFSHVASKTVDGVETCASCHAKGPVSVDVAHGLAPAERAAVAANFSAIVETVLVPRCATAACHAGSPPVAFPQLDAGAAYGQLVGVQSGQASMLLVEPGAPEKSYLLYKLRADAASAGGSPSTPMPPDTLLDAADVAAIEAWIANGAPND